MREIRQSGSEGGETRFGSFLPLSDSGRQAEFPLGMLRIRSRRGSIPFSMT